MAQRAQVASIEALEAFRASLIVYLAKARPVVEEATSELRRTQQWIDTEQRVHWEREFRRRARVLEEAQQALLSARISSFRDTQACEQMAVAKARHALDEADEKMRLLRRWSRDFGPLTQPLARPIDALDTLLAQDMSQAVAYLTELIRHLEAYADAQPAGPPATPAPEPPGSAAVPAGVPPGAPASLPAFPNSGSGSQ